jgi:hypothetical protein
LTAHVLAFPAFISGWQLGYFSGRHIADDTRENIGLVSANRFVENEFPDGLELILAAEL